MRQLIISIIIIFTICSQNLAQSSSYKGIKKSNFTVAMGELSTLSFNLERNIRLENDITIVGRLGLGLKGATGVFENTSPEYNFLHSVGIMKGWAGHHLELAYLGAYETGQYSFSPSVAYRYYFPFGLNVKVSYLYPVNHEQTITTIAGDMVGISIGYTFQVN